MDWRLKRLFIGLSNLDKGCSRTGTAALPRRMVFEPTTRCNLNCSMCDRIRERTEELSLPEIRLMIGKLPNSVKEVYVSGGEPLLRKDISDICGAFTKRGIRVSVQTNGTFPERAKQIAGIKGVDVMLSLDGPRNVHDRMRGRSGVHDSTMEILEFLKSRGKKAVVTTVVSDENLAHIKGLIESLAGRGLKPDLIILELIRRFSEETVSQSARKAGLSPGDVPVSSRKGAVPSYSLTELRKTISGIKRFLDRHGFSYTFYPIDMLSSMKSIHERSTRAGARLYCTHFDVLRVESNGDVVPCFVFRKPFGNLMKDDFLDIWNSAGFTGFRKRMLSSNLSPACETCFRAVRASRLDGILTGVRRGSK